MQMHSAHSRHELRLRAAVSCTFVLWSGMDPARTQPLLVSIGDSKASFVPWSVRQQIICSLPCRSQSFVCVRLPWPALQVDAQSSTEPAY